MDDGLAVRGISYFTEGVPEGALRRDLQVIADDLHCTTVMLIGADVASQVAAAQCALDAGLDVYVRPHLADRPRAAVMAHLAETARAAEALRSAHPGRITLLVGSEFSLTSRGMIPGPRQFVRVQVLVRWRRFFDRRITRKLRPMLAEALSVARAQFHGPITYAAAFWEEVDWSGFDLVGVNLYRMGTDHAAYERRVRELVERSGKSVVITEFGCGAFTGADRRGPGSFLIVNWLSDRPYVRDGHVRDEATQATYLGELIDLYAEAGVHGAFVFTFAMADFPHRSDPLHDLDMAGFGVVKVSPDDPTQWDPKAAFHEVARRYSTPAG